MRKVCNEAAADWIRYGSEYDGNCPRLAGKGTDHGRGHAEDRIRPQIDQLFCQRPHPIRITGAPAKFDPQIAAFRPPNVSECLPERSEPGLRFTVALGIGQQHTDPPHPFRLLRARRDCPGSRRATQKRDQLAPPHSITSSAISRKSGVIVSPRAFAALRLMTSSNFVGRCTGNSAGLAPLRILSTYWAVCRDRSGRLAP